MRELRGGLWHLQAPHPDRTEDEPWPREVSSNDLVLWVEPARAVVAGDSLVDFGTGLALNKWLRAGVTREEVVERLRPLLALPVEVVLPAHGAPTDRAVLEHAFS